LFTYRNGSLAVYGVRDEDEGVYQCIADNEAGSDSVNVTLSVLGKCVCVHACVCAYVCWCGCLRATACVISCYSFLKLLVTLLLLPTYYCFNGCMGLCVNIMHEI